MYVHHDSLLFRHLQLSRTAAKKQDFCQELSKNAERPKIAFVVVLVFYILTNKNRATADMLNLLMNLAHACTSFKRSVTTRSAGV